MTRPNEPASNDRANGANGSTVPGGQGEQSIGQLFAGLSDDLSALVRDELALAKAELSRNAANAAGGMAMFGGAAFLGYVAFLLLSAAAGLGLVAAGLHPAIAFLMIAVVYLLIAGALTWIGVRQLSRIKGPERSRQELAATKAMLRPGTGPTPEPGTPSGLPAAQGSP